MARRRLHRRLVGSGDHNLASDLGVPRRLWPDLWQPGGFHRYAFLLLAGGFRAGDRRASQHGTGGNPQRQRKGPKAGSGSGGMMAGLMDGKRGLIMGLANDKSLAWGIAKALSAQGAELAFS